LKVEIGKRLKRLRLEKGYTQKELAARVREGLDYTYIGKIERGEQLPSLKILIKISEALSVPVGYFFRDESVSAVREISAPGLKLPGKGEKGRELIRALKLLHEDDIPLIIEIVQVLSRHRNAMPESSAEKILMAAEKGTPYGQE
jgi:transcriptional regulator with XRE-family HTH domain